MIAEVGETVEDVGNPTAWLNDVPVAIHDGCLGFRQSMNPVVVSHHPPTAASHAEKSCRAAPAKIRRLSLSGISLVRIPVPSMAEQARIVSVLDRFDAPIIDLSKLLSTELAAKRRQFAYYHDRLIKFEDAA